MEGVKIKEVLKSYEEKVKDEDYSVPQKNNEETVTINNDVNRTGFISFENSDPEKIAVMRRLLRDVLLSIPVAYIQGMSEIAAVFIVHYYGTALNNFDFSLNTGSDKEDDEENNSEALYENFKNAIKDLFEKIRIVLVNVFVRKLNPLIENEFALYHQNISVFIQMMKKRNISIKEIEVHKYMGSIFTFFSRDVKNIEDGYRIFEIILACPNTAPFLLLVIYFDTISKKKKINYVDENLYNTVILLEAEFVETRESMRKSGGSFFGKNAIIIGGVAGFVLAFALYKFNKKD